MSSPTPSPLPTLWTPKESRQLLGSLVMAAVALLLGWLFAGGEAEPADQLPFAALAIGGCLVGLAGIFVWVARGRRRLGRRLHLLLGTAPPRRLDPVRGDALVAGVDRHWFHRQHCPLAAQRNWPSAPRRVHEQAARRACPACQP